MTDELFASFRDKALTYYRKVPKDEIAFDAAEVPDEWRAILIKDQEYNTKKKSIRAELYKKQIVAIDEILDDPAIARGKDNTASKLQAIKLKNEILFDELGVSKEDDSGLNISFTALTREQMEQMDTIEIFIPKKEATSNLEERLNDSKA